MKKVGRNDPCHCGSGKKYKKCCLSNNAEQLSTKVVSLDWKRMRETDDKLSQKIFSYACKDFPEFLPFAWCEFEDIDCNNISDIDHEDYVFVCAFMPWFLYNWEPKGCHDDLETDFEGTIAKAYLKRYGYTLSQFEKDFIAANLESQYTLCEVISITSGKSLKVKDLLLSREITIQEKSATSYLEVGSVTYSRIVTVNECSIFAGTYPKSMPANFIPTVIDFKQDYHIGDKGIEDLYDFDYEIRQLFVEMLDHYSNPQMPKLQNTDGEDFAPAKIYFDLKCTTEQAVDLLCELNQEESKEEIIAQADLNEDGQIDKVEFPWLVKGNKINKSWSNTIFAHLTISDGKLLIEVNSSERASKAKDKAQELLGEQAAYKNMLFESIESKLNELQSEQNQSSEIDINEHPEIKAKLKEMHDKHWSDWLDMNIPGLDDQTPREAAKTDEGREKLEALLSQFHQSNIKIKKDPDSHQHKIDLYALRSELNML